MKNRSEVEVMASILRSASTNWEYKTTIMNTATISHSQLVRYLAIAVEKGLVEYSEVTGLYKTTEAGLNYLDKYMQLVRLLPTVPDLPDIIVHRRHHRNLHFGVNEEEEEEEEEEQEQRHEELQQGNNAVGITSSTLP
jgi:predicted transcriptional regulator